jgi:conjugal transfer pilus assembly protein TraF
MRQLIARALMGLALVVGAASACAQSQSVPTSVGATAATPDKPFWRSAREGWFWYQDPAPEQQAKPPVQAAPPAPTGMDKDVADFNAFKKRFESAMHAAVQNPSPENSARFLELLAESRRKARTFTDTVRQAKAERPWLSAEADGVRPTLPLTAALHDQLGKEQRSRTLRALASTHGLYFFFRSDCPYCHNYAPLLKQFEMKYGISVLAISVDGGPIPHFPNAVRDSGQFLQILTDAQIPPDKVQVPFTALVSPRTREVMPLGFGVMNAEQVAEAIELTLVVRRQREQGGYTPPSLQALQ